jgi:hypothetical protein
LRWSLDDKHDNTVLAAGEPGPSPQRGAFRALGALAAQSTAAALSRSGQLAGGEQLFCGDPYRTTGNRTADPGRRERRPRAVGRNPRMAVAMRPRSQDPHRPFDQIVFADACSGGLVEILHQSSAEQQTRFVGRNLQIGDIADEISLGLQTCSNMRRAS